MQGLLSRRDVRGKMVVRCHLTSSALCVCVFWMMYICVCLKPRLALVLLAYRRVHKFAMITVCCFLLQFAAMDNRGCGRSAAPPGMTRYTTQMLGKQDCCFLMFECTLACLWRECCLVDCSVSQRTMHWRCCTCSAGMRYMWWASRSVEWWRRSLR